MNLSVAAFLLEEIEEHDEIPRRTSRDRSNVLEMPTKQFVGNFRVSKDIFLRILGTLKDKWPPAFRSTTIKPEVKLATLLRFVATGSYQQTVGNKHISSTSQSSAGRIIRECLQLFEEWVCPQWIKLPAAEEKSNIMGAFFESGAFPGVIGCVDGNHIRIKSPRNDEKRLYYNRKGYYSINAMAVCDHKMGFGILTRGIPAQTMTHLYGNKVLWTKFCKMISIMASEILGFWVMQGIS